MHRHENIPEKRPPTFRCCYSVLTTLFSVSISTRHRWQKKRTSIDTATMTQRKSFGANKCRVIMR